MLAKLLFALCSSTLGLSANIPSSRWDNEAYDTPDKSCPCGYVLTHYDNAYYPVYRRVTFDSLPKGKLQGPDALQSVGFDISDDIYVGGTGPENTTTVGHYANIAVADGDDGSSILRLLVPGGQHIGGNLSGAEIHSSQAFTGGVFTAEMQISPVVGTAQAVFTYHSAPNSIGPGAGPQDEQDIELLAAYLYKKGKNGTPPGIELTNYDPNDPNNAKNNNTIVPYPSNPTTAFHNYTIAWLPKAATKYYFDGGYLKSPVGYYSVNPSYLYLNNWSDGDPEFTLGPPKEDVVMQVKSVTMYYQTADKHSLPSGCSLKKACRV